MAIINVCGRGHIQVLEWFKNNNLPIDKNIIIQNAIKIKNIELLDWLKNNENIIYYKSLNYSDVINNWLLKNGNKLTSEILII